MPAGRSSTSTPGSLALLLGDRQQQAPGATREEGGRHLGEMGLDGRVRLREATLDGLGELGAQLLELSQRALEVVTLLGELGEALPLALELLGGERVHLAERDESPLEPVALDRELLELLLVQLGGRDPLGESPYELGPLRREPGRLDVELGEPRGRLRGGPTQVGFLGAEQAELLAGLRARGGAGVDPAAKRRLEAGSRPHRRVETGGEALGRVRQRRGALRVPRVDAWRHERDGGARTSHTLASLTLDLEYLGRRRGSLTRLSPQAPSLAGEALAGARGARS